MAACDVGRLDCCGASEHRPGRQPWAKTGGVADWALATKARAGGGARRSEPAHADDAELGPATYWQAL